MDALQKQEKAREGIIGGKSILATRVEKEYLKPSYTASIGEELEDGLFYGNHCNNCILYDPFESWAHLS